VRAALIVVRRLVFPPTTLLPVGLGLPQDILELAQIYEELRRLPEPAPPWFLLLLAALLTFLRSHFPPPVRSQIEANLLATVESLHWDYGIFPGCAIRAFFEKWLKIAAYRVLSPGHWEDVRTTQGKDAALQQLANLYDRDEASFQEHRNMTFQRHQEVFQAKLAVSGSNLSTYKTHLFSSSTTPRFLVSDAVRISMSLPIAFKPLVIESDADLQRVISPGEGTRLRSASSGRMEPHYLKGVWVDGGLLNNVPLHAFDNEPEPSPNTLGLRLNFEVRNEMRDFVDFLKVYPLGIMMGTGESQISQTLGNYERSIILDSRGIGLFDFQPPAAQLREAQRDAEARVRTYFT
jgi:NTE family protein